MQIKMFSLEFHRILQLGAKWRRPTRLHSTNKDSLSAAQCPTFAYMRLNRLSFQTLVPHCGAKSAWKWLNGANPDTDQDQQGSAALLKSIFAVHFKHVAAAEEGKHHI